MFVGYYSQIVADMVISYRSKFNSIKYCHCKSLGLLTARILICSWLTFKRFGTFRRKERTERDRGKRTEGGKQCEPALSVKQIEIHTRTCTIECYCTFLQLL